MPQIEALRLDKRSLDKALERQQADNAELEQRLRTTLVLIFSA